jgi:CO/xanthine dehydrogenase FAD-binding subunit
MTAAMSSSDARICLNAVHNIPYRVTKAEDAIKGKAIDAASAEAAGTAAVSNAVAMLNNKWSYATKYIKNCFSVKMQIRLLFRRRNVSPFILPNIP